MRELWALSHFQTCKVFSSTFMKQQNYNNSAQWTLIMKISTLLFLQLLKLKKIKCPYFFVQTSYYWDISFLWFKNLCPYVHHQITNHKMSKSSYLPRMISDLKSKGTLFSSTLKVEEVKENLFSWLEFILVSYVNIVISWRYRKTPHKSKKDKNLISLSNDIRSKK